jgi:hypothetical protein
VLVAVLAPATRATHLEQRTGLWARRPVPGSTEPANGILSIGVTRTEPVRGCPAVAAAAVKQHQLPVAAGSFQ